MLKANGIVPQGWQPHHNKVFEVLVRKARSGWAATP